MDEAAGKSARKIDVGRELDVDGFYFLSATAGCTRCIKMWNEDATLCSFSLERQLPTR